MANSDYIRRNVTAPLCPSATLIHGIGPLDDILRIGPVSSASTTPIRIGSAAMVDDEIVAVLGISGNVISIARGCGDTCPVAHLPGAVIWFFDDFVAGDRIEYAATETIAVKPLPRTANNVQVAIESSPPLAITFNSRFARPYPPANVQVSGVPWFRGFTFNNLQTTLTLSWNHRDRVLQQDVLVGHTAADIGPEPGTTYEVEVFQQNGTPIASFTGITGKTWTYTYATAITDFGASTQTRTGFIRLRSRRAGFASYQEYTIDLTVTAGNQTIAGSVTSDLALTWDVAAQPATAVTRDLPLNWIVFNTATTTPVSASESGIFVRDSVSSLFKYDIRAVGIVSTLQAVTMIRFVDGLQVTLNFIEGVHVFRQGNSVFMTEAGEALINTDLGTVIPTAAIFDYTFFPT